MFRFTTPAALLLLLFNPVHAAPKLLPVLNHSLADQAVMPASAPFSLDLSGAFGTEPIDDQVVRFSTGFSNSGQPVVLDMALFSNRTPVTRTNFLKYVSDGDYLNSFIHRSVPGFVIQGGGFKIVSNNITPVPIDPAIINEFGISNTLGTISMAKQGGDPNSATSQWFVSTGANSDNLDSQNGGFTVFGRVTKATLGNAQIFNDNVNFKVYDYRAQLGNPDLQNLPLFFTHQPPNVLISQLILFSSVGLVALPAGQAGESTALTYSVASNSNPAAATAVIVSGNQLRITPGTATGSTSITVRATDSVGNTVDDTLTVRIKESYSQWRARVFSGADATNDTVSAPAADPENDGLTNLELFVHGLAPGFRQEQVKFTDTREGSNRYPRFTFPIRNDISGVSCEIQYSNDLGGEQSWSSIPWDLVSSSTSGIIDAITIKPRDTTIGTPAFYRVCFRMD